MPVNVHAEVAHLQRSFEAEERLVWEAPLRKQGGRLQGRWPGQQAAAVEMQLVECPLRKQGGRLQSRWAGQQGTAVKLQLGARSTACWSVRHGGMPTYLGLGPGKALQCGVQLERAVAGLRRAVQDCLQAQRGKGGAQVGQL